MVSECSSAFCSRACLVIEIAAAHATLIILSRKVAIRGLVPLILVHSERLHIDI